MIKILRLAARNLARYWRRTLLTSALIILGIVAVLMFVSVSGSFKGLIVGQITDSMLGHLQIHRKGYVASIDNLPLNLNMKPAAVAKAEAALSSMPEVVGWTPRVKFGAMFSNFTETTSIRLNGIVPDREAVAMPLLRDRVTGGDVSSALVERGKVLIPEILSKGMKVKPGDTVVLVATNLDGSVNGKTFVVQGVLGDVTGPGGRDGYVHIEDARELLRMEQAEVSEIAVRLKGRTTLNRDRQDLEKRLQAASAGQGQDVLEVHSWEGLSPFANIARMIDLLDMFIRVMLIGIVLISVMNVMIMAVYERIREIGMISAVGTPPRRIMALFLAEGLLLGVAGTLVGTIISILAVAGLRQWPIHIAFARQQLVLAPSLGIGDTLLVGGIVIAVAVLASLQPAWKASRMDPIAALRHV